MADQVNHRRLETKAIVIGYAMSRLDKTYLAARESQNWSQAFKQAGAMLRLPPATFKNLRDEFDPLHPNPRKGWHKRPLRQNRRRVLDELHEVSNDALMELVTRILNREDHLTMEAVDSLAVSTRVAHNVAERLLTGRKAEEYFLSRCLEIAGVPSEELLDMRNAARGYDFGVSRDPQWAIEVKGIRRKVGYIQFTDREWFEAGSRRDKYWVVVVGNLAVSPIASIIRDPHATIRAVCRFQKSVAAVWHSRVSVSDS